MTDHRGSGGQGVEGSRGQWVKVEESATSGPPPPVFPVFPAMWISRPVAEKSPGEVRQIMEASRKPRRPLTENYNFQTGIILFILFIVVSVLACFIFW